ncbi:hypothetical protein DDB_G0269882 [Dictyostelium discoideum AX4]|uniref:Lipocalin/cytosolic fatty-acid binding domain-containing protein n=1 Tax=Dictyostelium discoideum TaxID=44689 RepID=Q55CV8_DICDI|nr:hypothetical protein DDB_G0269882 [Dictyostelium discoideum AX4]EAL72291.1 hypothetical protein DDB_G0269882 [Dictyostelium discoideum AX4]|eukprot:XP_646373.1 hypothetical protein DDB_G0269882 [Dictyostelium discoideum AX4]
MELLVGGTILGALTYAYSSLKRTIPEGAHACSPFYPEKYVGKWYEIARLDFYYERDMNNVSAEYTLNKDGTISVINSGYNYVEKKRESVNGKALFVHGSDEAMLKVSFFGPFYAGYNVIAIDPDYKYALVAGRSLDYLWILSRETSIPDHIKKQYLELAESIGYNTSKLIWTEHDNINNKKD